MSQEQAKTTERPDQKLLAAGDQVISRVEKLDPFWGPQLIVAGAILLDVSLPDKLTLGPTWVLPSFEGLLLIGLFIISPLPRMRHSRFRRHITMGLIGLVSAANLWSLYQLIHFLLHHNTSQHEGRPLILAGVVLWVTNVLLFGLWSGIPARPLDRGGPIERAKNPDAWPDFVFPQMSEKRHAPPGWMPRLIDYLYVPFTNATAFSPTDTMPLTQTAKVPMSVQALSALVTVGLVVARAVNLLS
jgi:hypothetical protein